MLPQLILHVRDRPQSLVCNSITNKLFEAFDCLNTRLKFAFKISSVQVSLRKYKPRIIVSLKCRNITVCRSMNEAL